MNVKALIVAGIMFVMVVSFLVVSILYIIEPKVYVPSESRCIYDLLGNASSGEPCYLVVATGSYSTTIPIDPNECGQLEYACSIPNLVTWLTIDCAPKRMYVDDAFVGCYCNRTEGFNLTVTL